MWAWWHPWGQVWSDLKRMPRCRSERVPLSGDRRIQLQLAGAEFRHALQPHGADRAWAPPTISSSELHEMLGMEPPAPDEGYRRSRLPWYSESVDSTYLTGKRVFIFGDGTHALAAAARICGEELGFTVVGLGTYSREMARPVRAAAKALGLEALISDDYLAVEAAMAEAAPELVLGTQMERHSAKRLGIPCAVISTPMHVQDVPARNSPQMGWEGRQCDLRRLGASADDGPGGTPDRHVPPRL